MSQPDSEEDPLIGAVLADRYRIDRRLGHGGMGSVYLAHHVRMHRPFAVKVLHREMSYFSEAVFRFEREAVASGRVDHRHLVTATDFGELAGGGLYLVMEYVPGKSLGDVLEDGPLPPVRALGIARQIAEALGAVHAAGIVHRDLKPDNVMLVDREEKDFVKLLDFGMAKVQMERQSLLPEVTQSGLVFGTPRYMAPEQAAGQSTDHRSDIYALGVVVYAMLAGEPPFSGDDVREILHKQRLEPPPPLGDSIDPAVVAFVMRLLRKDPAERPQTTSAVVEQIDAILGRLRARSDLTVGPLERAAAVAKSPAGIGAVSALVILAFAAGLVLSQRSAPARAGAEASAAVSAGAPAASALTSGRARTIASASTSALGSPARDVSSPSDPALERLLARAEVGEEQALAELEARPDAERSAREWFVVGAARAEQKDYLGGVRAYGEAVDGEPDYAKNSRMLRDILHATDDKDAWKTALHLAAALPGQRGADILFKVWASTPKQTDKTRLAKQLLELSAVRERASDATKIAFDLRTARGCDARRELLVQAMEQGDTRSLRPLVALRSVHGCGPKKKDDCFECLRGDDVLERAIEAVERRKEPTF